MFLTGLKTLGLLMPLILIFMQGPSVSTELALGTLLSVGGLFITRQVRELKRAVPYVACMFAYLAMAYYWKDQDNDLSAKYTLGLMLYLLPCGLLLREFTDRGKADGVLLGIGIFSLALALAGLDALRTVGVENLVKTLGLSLSRSNVDTTSYTYLRYFTILNVIIGMSTFGICGLAGFVVVALRTPLLPKAAAVAAFGVALYINIQVITRGAIVSAALGMICVMPWIALNMGARKVIRYSAVALVALAGVIAYAYFANHALWEKGSVLVERISQTGDDTRLTHWNEAVGIFERNYFGGGRGYMQTHKWAHNFFLDTALTAGIPGVLSLACFLLLTFFNIARVLLRGRRVIHPVFLVLLSQFLAVLILTMTSPPSLPLFGVLVLGAGFFAAPLSREQAYGY